MQLQPDTLLQGGKYKIKSVLGQGGFGITYLGWQDELNRYVAIKEFFMKEYCDRNETTSQVSLGTVGNHEQVERFRQKFIKEAQLIAGLNNTYIIPIYDIFNENGTSYYIMEYINDGSLKDKIEAQRAMSSQEATTYIQQVAKALQYLHDRNIMHLDVKPSNILLRNSNEVVLIDFGLSKRYDSSGSQTSSTPIGISKGYAPLEQYNQEGIKAFSPCTDIYSLGATFLYLLTGKQPPEAIDVYENGIPALPPSIPVEIITVINNAMQPKQKDRLQSTEAFMRLKATQESQNLKENEDEEDSETVVVNKNIAPNPINAEITTRVTPLPKKRYANQRNLFINLWLIFLFILTCFTEINVAWISIGYFDLIFTSLFIALFPFCYYITGLYQLYLKNQKAGFWMIGSGTMIVLCFIFSVAAEWLTPDGGQGADILTKSDFMQTGIKYGIPVAFICQFLFYLILLLKKNGVSTWELLEDGSGWMNEKVQRYIFLFILIAELCILLQMHFVQ